LNIPAATVFFQGNNAQDMADKGVLADEEPICSIELLFRINGGGPGETRP
jgi:hypothetical protein